MQRYDFLVFIGRFQMFHRGHEKVCRRALELADNLIVLTGSDRRAPDLRHPWSSKDRSHMIYRALDDVKDRITVRSIEDFTYSDGEWEQHVYEIVTRTVAQTFTTTGRQPVIGLIGHSKDHTSYYLKSFRMWGAENVPGYTDDRLLSASWIREQLFMHPEQDLPENLLHPAVMHYIRFFTPDLPFQFQEELNKVCEYRAKYGVGPFNAGDALIRHDRRVLLVERGKWPGKGLWALPGGFLNPWETLEGCARRELGEETDLVAGAAPVRYQTFADPHRDIRAHIISHCFRWDMLDEQSPDALAGDDAADARFFSEAEIQPEMMYSDHFHIIRAMLRRTH